MSLSKPIEWLNEHSKKYFGLTISLMTLITNKFHAFKNIFHQLEDIPHFISKSVYKQWKSQTPSSGKKLPE